MLIYTAYTWSLVIVAGLIIFLVTSFPHLRLQLIIRLLTSLVTAFVLSLLIWQTGPLDLIGSLKLAFICWLAFQVPLYPFHHSRAVLVRQLLALSLSTTFLAVFF